jgi:hypothetical protein
MRLKNMNGTITAQLQGGMMKKNVLALVIAVVTSSSFAANRAEALCSSKDATSLVKQIIREQMMPGGTAEAVPDKIFAAATKVENIVPTRFDSELHIAECQAAFTVDAAANLDADTDRYLQVRYAREPDVLLGLMQSFYGPENARRYNVPVQYSVQTKDGRPYVRLARITELESYVTSGLLLGLMASGSPGRPN